MILHGANAPSEATLKKWSAGGEFRACLIAPDEIQRAPGTHAKPGRPGLQLITDRAIARVYELWPQLADSDPRAVFEQAVARTARQLAAAIRPLVYEEGALATSPAPAPHATAQPAQPEAQSAWQQRIEQTLTTLSQDMKELRREMAQFSSLRNNLMTRLDEVVARSRESLSIGARVEGGSDPIVEARRDRDMGVLKSTIDQILSTLERLEETRSA